MNHRNITPWAVRATACAALALTAASAQALTITPTFAASYDAASRAAIESAIGFYESRFTDNVSVTIDFVDSGSGLGSSSQAFYTVDYATYRGALAADGTSVDDAAANAGLPFPATHDPVTGGSTVFLTRANAAAVGLTVGSVPDGVHDWDATIDLNLSITNATRTAIDPDKYDLEDVAMHEMDEVLGTVSWLPNHEGIAPIDLFRRTAAGARTFTTAGDDAWFSIDGSTRLARFNQDAGGDYGDFWSTGPHPYEIQDAFSTPGAFADMNVETRMLDVVGYTLATSAVPEPATFALWLGALVALPVLRRRR